MAWSPNQIFAGLFGAIIVEDADPVDASTERVLIMSDTTLDGLGRWRLVNACVARYLRLRLD